MKPYSKERLAEYRLFSRLLFTAISAIWVIEFVVVPYAFKQPVGAAIVFGIFLAVYIAIYISASINYGDHGDLHARRA